MLGLNPPHEPSPCKTTNANRSQAHRVCGALLLGHDEGGDGEHRIIRAQLPRQDAARLNAPPRVAHRVAAGE